MPLSSKLRAALRALGQKAVPGAGTHRLEAYIDDETNDVLNALAVELAGKTGNPRQKRSTAARYLIKRGADAILADGGL